MRRCVWWAAAAGLAWASLGASAHASEDVLCLYGERGAILCPAAAGCCENFCCVVSRPGRPPDAPSLSPSPSGSHLMPFLVGTVFFVGVSCFVGICVSGVIKACRHRSSAPAFEACPAAPYPPQPWPPAPPPARQPAPLPAPLPAPVAMPMPMAPPDDPPPPYHTVVRGAPPPF